MAAFKAARDMLKKQKQSDVRAHENRDQIFIVVFFSNLKRMGEGVLKWSFFTLNVFILTLYMCSTVTNYGPNCPQGMTCVGMGFMPVYPSTGDSGQSD